MRGGRSVDTLGIDQLIAECGTRYTLQACAAYRCLDDVFHPRVSNTRAAGFNVDHCVRRSASRRGLNVDHCAQRFASRGRHQHYHCVRRFARSDSVNQELSNPTLDTTLVHLLICSRTRTVAWRRSIFHVMHYIFKSLV